MHCVLEANIIDKSAKHLSRNAGHPSYFTVHRTSNQHAGLWDSVLLTLSY